MRIIDNGTSVENKKMKGKNSIFFKMKKISPKAVCSVIIIPGVSSEKTKRQFPVSNTREIMLITNCELLMTIVTFLEHKWQLSQHLLVTISKKDSCSFVLSVTHLGFSFLLMDIIIFNVSK